MAGICAIIWAVQTAKPLAAAVWRKAAGCACYATAKTGFTGFTAALRQFYGYATGAKPDGAPYLHGGRLLMGNISYRFSDMEYIVFSARHDAAGVGWGKEDA